MTLLWEKDKMTQPDAQAARIRELERRLAEKDMIIADLVKRHLESREHALEQRVSALEQALRKWMTTALKGKIEIVARSTKR